MARRCPSERRQGRVALASRVRTDGPHRQETGRGIQRRRDTVTPERNTSSLRALQNMRCDRIFCRCGFLAISKSECCGRHAPDQVLLLEPWFSNRTKSIIKSPKLYISDTGLLCALLNIRSEDALRQSPSVGAVWETFVFAQLRHR